MFGRDDADDLLRVDLVGVVDRDDEVPLVREALQRIHPVVRRGRQPAILGPGAVIPGGAGLGGAGERPHVGVHDGDVLVISERAEEAAFFGVGIGQQPQRGVGMRGHDHAVETLFAFRRRDDGRGALAADRSHALAEAEIGRVGFQQRLDVSP